MNQCTIQTLSPMECIVMVACESERSSFGGQIRIGTVITEDRTKQLTIQFPDMRPIPVRSLEHALFQARMWRGFAQTFDGRKTPDGEDAAWVSGILRMSRRQCLARSRAWVIAAGMWNQACRLERGLWSGGRL